MKRKKLPVDKFKKEIWNYYKMAKRDMPWRETTDPYKIMVSEIMLQQTQVLRVIPKYEAFIKRFPDFKTLGNASLAEVFRLWQGLGYNRRAKFLKEAAKIVSEQYEGKLPETIEEIDALPGIGHATAAAILAYSKNLPVSYIETNIRRTYIHFFFSNRRKVGDDEILKLVSETVDQKNPREWYYALMDYGAKLKNEVVNPNRKSKHYAKQSKFEGSNRQIRGRILKILLRNGPQTLNILEKEAGDKDVRTKECIDTLLSEGLLQKKGSVVELAH